MRYRKLCLYRGFSPRSKVLGPLDQLGKIVLFCFYRCEDDEGYNYGFPEYTEHTPKFYKQLVKEHGYDLKEKDEE